MGKKVSVRYVGRRVSGDKLMFAFLHGEQEVYWSKMKYPIIGHCYFAEENGDRLSMSQRPETDESARDASEEDMQAWQVQDALARDYQRRKSLAAKMDKHPGLDRAAAAIRPLLKGLDFSQRRALVDILMKKASKGPDGFVD